MQSRSPRHSSVRREGAHEYYVGDEWNRHRREQDDRGYRESQRMLSREQSVSDGGHSPVAAAQLKRDAETRTNQIQCIGTFSRGQGDSMAKYVPYALGPPSC